MSTTELKALELKPETLAMAKLIEPCVTVTDTGTAEFAKDTVEKALPEGLTLETVKTVQAFTNTFEAAANYVVGQKGITHFENNPNSSTVMGSCKIGHDTYQVAMARMQSVSAGVGVGRKEVPGNLTSGIKSSNPEAKKSVQIIRNMAESLRGN